MFQKGILQAVESLPKSRRRGMLGYGKPSPLELLRARLSIVQIIPAKDIKQVEEVSVSAKQGKSSISRLSADQFNIEKD